MKKDNHELLNSYIQAFITKYKKQPCFKTIEVAKGIQTSVFIQPEYFLAIGYCNTDDRITSETYTLSAIETFKNIGLKVED